jgi:hypothetical protein
VTAAIQARPTTGRRSLPRETALMVDAAARQDVHVRHDTRWDVYLINGAERPDARPMLARLIRDGVLTVADPDAPLSLVLPSGGTR